MNNDNNTTSPGAVEQAMNLVLEAERAAEQAIADCEQEAQEIINAAHRRARRIAERTDERLAHAHMHCGAVLSREIQHTERTATAAQQERYRLDTATLEEIADSVAAQLTEGPAVSGTGKDGPQ
jgi:cell division septum initiation protein DivIVA